MEHIKFVLDVNHARALALLEANQWNEHRTVDAYFSDPEGLCTLPPFQESFVVLSGGARNGALCNGCLLKQACVTE